MRRTGDVDPHGVGCGDSHGGAVAERDLCQAAERTLDIDPFDLGDDQLRNERRRFGYRLLGAHAKALCLAIDGREWLGSGQLFFRCQWFTGNAER
jgi:hypothetical protein